MGNTNKINQKMVKSNNFLIAAVMAYKSEPIHAPAGAMITVTHSIDKELDAFKNDLFAAGGKALHKATEERHDILNDIADARADEKKGFETLEKLAKAGDIAAKIGLEYVGPGYCKNYFKGVAALTPDDCADKLRATCKSEYFYYSAVLPQGWNDN